MAINFSYFIYGTLPHLASFISRKILEKCGEKYDENFILTADWKFYIDSICRYNATIKCINTVISSYNLFGLSSITENRNKLIKEKTDYILSDYNKFIEHDSYFADAHDLLKKNIRV